MTEDQLLDFLKTTADRLDPKARAEYLRRMATVIATRSTIIRGSLDMTGAKCPA